MPIQLATVERLFCSSLTTDPEELGPCGEKRWARFPVGLRPVNPSQASPPTVWRSHKAPPKALPLLPRSEARPKSSKPQETQTMTHEKILYNTEELVCQVMPGHFPGQSLERSLMAPRVGAWQWEGPRGGALSMLLKPRNTNPDSCFSHNLGCRQRSFHSRDWRTFAESPTPELRFYVSVPNNCQQSSSRQACDDQQAPGGSCGHWWGWGCCRGIPTSWLR